MPTPVTFRAAPDFFRQGPSTLTRWVVLSCLAVALMVADRHWALAPTARAAVATALYPLQWLLLQPRRAVTALNQRLQSVDSAQQHAQVLANDNLVLREQSQRAAFLQAENQRLRTLLDLRQQLPNPSQVAQLLYRVADPYARRIVIDHGAQHGIARGSLVLDAHGVLGQVTQVQAHSAEVTLITDTRQHTPVMNLRSQAPGILVGSGWDDAPLELQRVAANTDVLEDDVLVTSGLDGMFAPGLPVARVSRIVRAPDGSVELIFARPLAATQVSRDLMVLRPGEALFPPAPQ